VPPTERAGDVREVDHLIIGGGMTAAAAAMALADADPDARVALLSAEDHAPYDRPPLSKDLWQGDAADPSEIQHDRDLFGGAEVLLSRRIVRLDAGAHEAVDDAGTRWRYGRALLATGARPVVPPFAEGIAVARPFRTLADFTRLRERTRERRRVTVVGGGFLGSELAAALVGTGASVTMVFPERDVLARVLPAALAARVSQRLRRAGVEVRAGTLVDALVPQRPGDPDAPVEVRGDDGERWTADEVVLCVGVRPNVEVAREAGVEVDDGIVVDDRFRTSAPDLFAAGDVARFPAPALGPMRVEHEEHAKLGGMHAGRIMAGADEPYDHLPMFYSDVLDLGYEAVGRVDARLDAVVTGPAAADDAAPDAPGMVWYRDEDGRPVGALAWNAFGHLEAAREVLREARPFEASELRRRVALEE
jgi:NADPH-dependent 2,4-dienoyl-CoA reductase/sulfur reductase-like enzyme